MKDEKKLAAAMAAVMLYIQTEEEAMVHPQKAAPAKVPVHVPLWAMSGRQTMMQLRNLMQLKSFHGSRIR